MLRVVGSRLLTAMTTLLGLSLLAFVLIRLVPGDPVMLMLGERGASPAAYTEMQSALGLDLPVWRQYGAFLWNAAQGDLGHSIVSKQAVFSEFSDRFPATIELSFFALFFSIIIGIPLGIFAAVKRNSFLDYSFMGTSLVGYSMPVFWWALILILFFSINLGWTPVAGRMNVIFEIPSVTGFMLIDSYLSDEGWNAFLEAVRHLILPSMALGTIPLAVIARMTRSSLLEVLNEDYIRTARAKGLSSFRVIALHGLRNALIPILTVVGLMVGALMTGAMLTETIFSWPGIGKWIVASIMARDYPVIQGGVLLIGSTVIIINVVVDILYVVVNPRLRKS